MTFAAPLFLMAALAAAIPIVLNMLDRRNAKEAPFPTLRFLKLSAEKTRRRKRIHDVLLTAIRAALLLLVAIGLARPTISTLGALWGSAPTAAVIILDNSASMGMIDRDHVRLDTASAAATQILDQLTEGDQVALLPTCGPMLSGPPKLDRTQDSVRQMLGACRVSYERADLASKLRQARKLLAGSDAPNKQIYVLTDMQRAAWEQGAVVGGQGSDTANQQSSVNNQRPQIPNPQSLISVILVDCNRAPKPNVAVQGIDVETAIPLVGLPVKATATMLNTSTVAQQRLVELLIDGGKEAESPELNLPPLGRAKHEFTFCLKQAGLHRGEVRLLGEDGSKYDDRRFFTVEIEQGIPVAVIESRRHEIPYLDDAYYLERALAPGGANAGAIHVTTFTVDDLAEEPLEKYKVLFAVNLPAFSEEAANRLAAYLAGGGRVVWICGDNVRPEAYNRMNDQAGGQLLPAPLVDVRTPGPQDHRDSWHVGFLDKHYPAFHGLVEPASLYESVLVYKHVRMAAKQGAVRVLARLDDGEPLLVEQDAGPGRVLMLGASAQVNWSNLPLRPIFMPLVTQLTLDLAQVEQTHSALLAGQPIVLQLAKETKPLGVELIPPSGETLRLKTEVAEGKAEQTFRYARTDEIGVYRLRLLNAAHPRQIAYAVNFDPDEADPTKIGQAELRSRLGGAPLIFAENPDDLSSTFALLREGKSLWSTFLAAVLIALVFETFLSNRFSATRRAPERSLLFPGARNREDTTAGLSRSDTRP
jgi:hypothetical protein